MQVYMLIHTVCALPICSYIYYTQLAVQVGVGVFACLLVSHCVTPLYATQ
jgi:hypothetical protein